MLFSNLKNIESQVKSILNCENELSLIIYKVDKNITYLKIIEGENDYLAKSFENKEYIKQIKNYHTLLESSACISHLISHSEKLALFDSSGFDLYGNEPIISNECIKKMASWLKKYHESAKIYSFYDTSFRNINRYFSKERIMEIANKYNLKNSYSINLIINNFESIYRRLVSLEYVISIRDLSLLSFIEKVNSKELFLYNIEQLFFNYRYNAIKRITCQMDSEQKKIFLNEYGEVNDDERLIDEVVSPILNLCLKNKIEGDVTNSLSELMSSDYIEKIKDLLRS